MPRNNPDDKEQLQSSAAAERATAVAAAAAALAEQQQRRMARRRVSVEQMQARRDRGSFSSASARSSFSSRQSFRGGGGGGGSRSSSIRRSGRAAAKPRPPTAVDSDDEDEAFDDERISMFLASVAGGIDREYDDDGDGHSDGDGGRVSSLLDAGSDVGGLPPQPDSSVLRPRGFGNRRPSFSGSERSIASTGSAGGDGALRQSANRRNQHHRRRSSRSSVSSDCSGERRESLLADLRKLAKSISMDDLDGSDDGAHVRGGRGEQFTLRQRQRRQQGQGKRHPNEVGRSRGHRAANVEDAPTHIRDGADGSLREPGAHSSAAIGSSHAGIECGILRDDAGGEPREGLPDRSAMTDEDGLSGNVSLDEFLSESSNYALDVLRAGTDATLQSSQDVQSRMMVMRSLRALAGESGEGRRSNCSGMTGGDDGGLGSSDDDNGTGWKSSERRPLDSDILRGSGTGEAGPVGLSLTGDTKLVDTASNVHMGGRDTSQRDDAAKYDSARIESLIQSASLRPSPGDGEDGSYPSGGGNTIASFGIAAAVEGEEERSDVGGASRPNDGAPARRESKKLSLMSSLRALATSLDDETLLLDSGGRSDEKSSTNTSPISTSPLPNSINAVDAGQSASDASDACPPVSGSRHALPTLPTSTLTSAPDGGDFQNNISDEGDDHRTKVIADESMTRHIALGSEKVMNGGSPKTQFEVQEDATRDTSFLFANSSDAQVMAQNFAAEHRIFLSAALELLSYKEKVDLQAVQALDGPRTGTVSSAASIVKTGSLKKASYLVKGKGQWKWKMKYVEIRKGLFTYYDDSGADCDVDQTKKAVPLEATRCTCRAVKVRNSPLSSANGFIFELTVNGGPKRLWMAKSKQERHSWISAIYEAMVGGSITRGDNFFVYQAMDRNEKKKAGTNGSFGVSSDCPHKTDLDHYLVVQNHLKHAQTKADYLGGLSELWKKPLRIPVSWIRVQMEASKSASAGDAFNEGTSCSGIDQLWKDMLRDSISINDDVIKGDSGHGPERIIGSLTRCIMDFDRSSPLRDELPKKANRTSKVCESQAISYARDILLACNRTRSAGDSYYCFDTLCGNQDLVVLCPYSSEAEPLKVVVKHTTTEEGMSQHAKRDWIRIRISSGKKPWCNRYCVLSEGILSYYQKEHPMPHKLQGKVLLDGALMETTTEATDYDATMPESSRLLRMLKEKVKMKPESGDEASSDGVVEPPACPDVAPRQFICIAAKDGNKNIQMWFDDKRKWMEWKDALQGSIDACASELKYAGGNVGDQCVTRSDVGPDAKDANVEAYKNGGDGRNSTCGSGVTATLRMNEAVRNVGKTLSSTVQVTVEASTVYKICTIDPEGVDHDDTWATLQTKFVQSFRLSGGPRGKIMRGEEIVQMLFLEGLARDDAFDQILKANQSRLGLLEGLSQRSFYVKKGVKSVAES